jgi:hypothetical protein
MHASSRQRSKGGSKGMDSIKKIYTLNINNYAPNIRDITYPLIKHYAKKIGAEFVEITERKFPDMPPVMEKFQLYELAKENDWTIYLDADTLVHPETIDWTEYISKDTVLFNGKDFSSIRFSHNNYMRRDGRNIGACTWNVTCSDWTYDLWTPPEDYEKSLKDIYPVVHELNTVVVKSHLIDDYTLTNNIARFGLKHKCILDIQKELLPESNFYWHIYTETIEEKVRQMKEIINQWKITSFLPKGE